MEYDWLQYAEAKIFKVSKAITKHLANVLKTSEGLFLETTVVDNLWSLRDLCDDMVKNKDNLAWMEQAYKHI